MHNMLK